MYVDYGYSGYSSGLGVFGIILWLLVLLVLAFSLFCMWKLFVKAGYEGWKALIPIYNTYCFFEMTWGNGWLMLLSLIPFVNFVILILTYHKLAAAFGKGIGFTVGLLFAPVVFLPLLAFGDAEYEGI